jgi:hypothetical protein
VLGEQLRAGGDQLGAPLVDLQAGVRGHGHGLDAIVLDRRSTSVG